MQANRVGRERMTYLVEPVNTRKPQVWVDAAESIEIFSTQN